jgi:GTP 3',8-cyclase
MGFWKVRITGGEPTLRPDIVELIATVHSVPGVRRVALSTNAYRLNALAAPLQRAGLTHLNVSVDSLDRNKFQKITGQDRLPQVLQGIEKALSLGYSSVKANTVWMKGENDQELGNFLDWIRNRPVAVRFIELMQTGDNLRAFKVHHSHSTSLQRQLLQGGWKRKISEDGAGPAVEFCHPDYVGTVGIIAPYASEFCASCNRLRVSSLGKLQLCLFGEGGYSLREFLQGEYQREDLKQTVRSAILKKQVGHSLQKGVYGNTANFASIGG